MWFKRQKHYPRPFPPPGAIQSLAHGLAYDAGDVPRRHERWFYIEDLWMDRPVRVVSQKNWDRIIAYLREAQRNVMDLIATWPRRRIPRPRRIRPCQVRGWTWTRQPLSNPHPPPRRRRYILPLLVAKTTGPPRRLTALGEGRPSRREPETTAVIPLVGYSGTCSGPTRPKPFDNRIQYTMRSFTRAVLTSGL
ncbi:MAG: hypothetical protein LUC93_17780 [Planctomycetaceae bacterium]|nr:hypothetical protein [Planctomycetaceae bacterium]